jgi:hypothetical protein
MEVSGQLKVLALLIPGNEPPLSMKWNPVSHRTDQNATEKGKIPWASLEPNPDYEARRYY